MKNLLIQTQKPYTVYINQEWLISEDAYHILQKNTDTFFIICDKVLENSWGKQLYDFLKQKNHKVHLLAIEAKESSKTREYKQFIEDYMLQSHCQKDTKLIALGGGLICDLAGFTAATYYRGIPVIYIPSTLLAMVDASIGGKTAVNTAWGKNLIGCFKQAEAVLIDVNLLQNLPTAEIKEALAEIIKHACLKDAELFESLLKNKEKIMKLEPAYLQYLIEKNCEIKKAFVEQDEFDEKERRALNLGHTLGHALENASHYSLRHGEAVALGLLAEVYLGQTLQITDSDCLAKILNILQLYDLLALNKLKDIQPEALTQALNYDKKGEHETIKMPFLKSVGEIAHFDYSIELPQLKEALDYLYAFKL